MAAIISIEMPWMRSELSVMVVGFCKYRVLWGMNKESHIDNIPTFER